MLYIESCNSTCNRTHNCCYNINDDFPKHSYIKDNGYGELDLEYSSQKTADELPKKDLLIDESTTSYKLWDIHKKCLMYEFAKEHYPGYQPQDGFGYYEEIDMESKLHKKIILMDEVNFTLLVHVINKIMH